MTTPRESTTSNSAGEQQADLPSTTAGRAEFLDPQQTSLEASSLAAHLQRVGIRWLPTANPQATAEFASRFTPSPEADAPTSPTVDVETQDKSDKSQVAPQNSNEITNGAASPPTSGHPLRIVPHQFVRRRDCMGFRQSKRRRLLPAQTGDAPAS